MFAGHTGNSVFRFNISGLLLRPYDTRRGPWQRRQHCRKRIGPRFTEYTEKTGETSRWTNSVFSGMPTYQIAPSYKSTSVLTHVEQAYHLWLPQYVWYLFAYLLGFYILLRAFDFRQSLAALGSVIWAFSSYFLIIIAAGHIWKVMALAYLRR